MMMHSGTPASPQALPSHAAAYERVGERALLEASSKILKLWGLGAGGWVTWGVMGAGGRRHAVEM